MTDTATHARTELRGGALWLTLDRPEAMNSLTPSMMDELESSLDRLDADPSIRALVITGTGRAFCAGADLKAVLASGGDADPRAAFRAFIDRGSRLFRRIEQAPVPTIAALNGITLAGGLEVALACDVIVAVEGARIGEGHAKYGQLPGGGGSVRLPRRVGASQAKYLMFTGDLLVAPEARTIGLVDVVAPKDQLEDIVAAMVTAIGAASPLGLREMKRLVDQGFERGVDEALSVELETAVAYAQSHDMNEGLQAFSEGRSPRFAGK